MEDGGPVENRAIPAREGPSHRFDVVAALMGGATMLVLAGTLWLRFGPAPGPEPLAVGTSMPPLRLIDPRTSEPLVFMGLRNRILWVVFWSARSPNGRELLPRLQSAWNRLRARRGFALVTATPDEEPPTPTVEATIHLPAGFPAYRARVETRMRFGAEPADLPLHLLVDDEGRIAAMARGAGGDVIDRLVAQARSRLDEIDPLPDTRFADATSRPSTGLAPENDIVRPTAGR